MEITNVMLVLRLHAANGTRATFGFGLSKSTTLAVDLSDQIDHRRPS